MNQRELEIAAFRWTQIEPHLENIENAISFAMSESREPKFSFWQLELAAVVAARVAKPSLEELRAMVQKPVSAEDRVRMREPKEKK